MSAVEQAGRGMDVPDHMDVAERFDIKALEAETLSGSLEGGLNACVECCDRHAEPGRVALYYESRDGTGGTLGFVELKERAARFANYLVSQGVRPGDRVAGLLPRVPELLVVILGTWRAGAVYQPLFTAFGPKAIEYRVGQSGAKLIVTDTVNRPKLDEVAGCPPVLVAGKAADLRPGDPDFHAEMARQPDAFEPVMLKGSDPMMRMFTSGTTGPAKGVEVPLEALLSFAAYMRFAVDLRPDDAYWNIADPGWAYGLYYNVAGPLLLGHAVTFYDGPFTVEDTWRVIRKLGITNLAGAPTAWRMLMAAGGDGPASVKGRLRAASSAGEALNPEVIRWFAEHLDCPIHDHYGQTEMGMVLCNHHGLRHAIHPGSAGYASPGFRLGIIDDAGREVPDGTPGTLAVDVKRSPLFWFRGYLGKGDPAPDGWYRTGDTVERNPDGSISSLGRGDDIITSAGYRIGPYDVESALIEHPAVLETAVVGKPDPERTEIVKAFVVLRPGNAGTPELAEALQQLVRRRLAAHAYPREVEFVTELPKTPSGKIQRFLLRQKEAERAKEGG